MSTETPSLRDYTRIPDELFALPDKDLLFLIKNDFESELKRLTRAYSLYIPNVDPPPTPSPSEILFNGEVYHEVNRTLVGVLALKWIWNGDYDTFVGNQPESEKLPRDSFEWTRQFYRGWITSPDELYALLTSIVVNDLGKDKELAADCQRASGEDVSLMNHDKILLKACEAGLVGCMDRLPKEIREDIMRGFELGADLNFGQLAQAENAPASLASFETLKSWERPDRVLKFRFMEQLLDIAGAAGHLDWTCAYKSTHSVFEAYHTVYDAGLEILKGKMSLREAYDLVLIRRGELLYTKGFRSLDLDREDDRSLARILCMASVADFATAELFEQAWNTLEVEVRDSLIHSLNIDGSVAEPAVQATYSPALVTSAFKAGDTADEKMWFLQHALRFVARVMAATDRPDGPVTVIERNVKSVVGIVQGPEFCDNPSILENEPVPVGTAAIEEN
ncbi:hypothetical protein F4779DRAFT_585517 [Xylariaceae sp. FL0662B]|nr:hypothetical protein F4779DRAFT_585517 [Xylariaceae sp. FL0662B]